MGYTYPRRVVHARWNWERRRLLLRMNSRRWAPRPLLLHASNVDAWDAVMRNVAAAAACVHAGSSRCGWEFFGPALGTWRVRGWALRGLRAARRGGRRRPEGGDGGVHDAPATGVTAACTQCCGCVICIMDAAGAKRHVQRAARGDAPRRARRVHVGRRQGATRTRVCLCVCVCLCATVAIV
jgi:hypothetical protein